MRSRWLRRFPLPLFLIGVAISFVIIEYPPLTVSYGLGSESMKRAEFYPLSSFPMYSRFSDSPVVVYVADGDGVPLASLIDFVVRTSILKKFYDGELRRIKEETGVPMSAMTMEQKRPAGDATLRHMVEHIAPPTAPTGQPLTLYELVIGFGDGEHGIATESTKVGEWRP